MKIEFVGEEAVDEGGPLTEPFSLVYIMTGGNNGFTFLHDVRKLADGLFFEIRPTDFTLFLAWLSWTQKLNRICGKTYVGGSIICSNLYKHYSIF